MTSGWVKNRMRCGKRRKVDDFRWLGLVPIILAFWLVISSEIYAAFGRKGSAHKAALAGLLFVAFLSLSVLGVAWAFGLF